MEQIEEQFADIVIHLVETGEEYKVKIDKGITFGEIIEYIANQPAYTINNSTCLLYKDRTLCSKFACNQIVLDFVASGWTIYAVQVLKMTETEESSLN